MRPPPVGLRLSPLPADRQGLVRGRGPKTGGRGQYYSEKSQYDVAYYHVSRHHRPIGRDGVASVPTNIQVTFPNSDLVERALPEQDLGQSFVAGTREGEERLRLSSPAVQPSPGRQLDARAGSPSTAPALRDIQHRARNARRKRNHPERHAGQPTPLSCARELSARADLHPRDAR
jgi:hypothetical protein